MNRKTLFTIETLYRQPIAVEGFCYGEGEPSACVVGAMRGNEIQQLYTASQIIRTLTQLEELGLITPGKSVMVVPCVNQYSMNVGKRFWPTDNTDINRMFPGYNLGETTQRIADSLFTQVKHYLYGFHLASFYLPGDFLPHVRMMDTGYQSGEIAAGFDLPYVVLRKPQPYDTTTLNYNWQVFGTNAFSVYTKETDEIDVASARLAVHAIIDFLCQKGVLTCPAKEHDPAAIIREESLCTVHSPDAGLFTQRCTLGAHLNKGELMAEILDPFTGEVRALVEAPMAGRLFFAHKAQLTSEHDVAFRLIPE
ncbi:MAG: M14 family metallopeptidase [Eubacteriales bacterium]|nr:M14 family metallopeptidase [Eubacteriales bacterium]